MLSIYGGAIGKNANNTVAVEALPNINLYLREGGRAWFLGLAQCEAWSFLRFLM